ncbi:MAG: hypothetical protein WDZ76_13420 [Pseudohongiellaceae bacterium]
MKLRYLTPALFAFVAATTFAQQQPGQQQGQQQTRDFEEVDTNSDGELSIREARDAFPDLEITGRQDDDPLRRQDAERAMPGLQLSESQDDRDEPVGRMDYLIIVDTMQRQEQSGQSGQPGQSDQPGQQPGQ